MACRWVHQVVIDVVGLLLIWVRLEWLLLRRYYVVEVALMVGVLVLLPPNAWLGCRTRSWVLWMLILILYSAVVRLLLVVAHLSILGLLVLVFTSVRIVVVSEWAFLAVILLTIIIIIILCDRRRLSIFAIIFTFITVIFIVTARVLILVPGMVLVNIRAWTESCSWWRLPYTTMMERLLQRVVIGCVNIGAIFILVLLLLLITILIIEVACLSNRTHGGARDSLLRGLSKGVRHVVPLRRTVTRVNITSFVICVTCLVVNQGWARLIGLRIARPVVWRRSILDGSSICPTEPACIKLFIRGYSFWTTSILASIILWSITRFLLLLRHASLVLMLHLRGVLVMWISSVLELWVFKSIWLKHDNLVFIAFIIYLLTILGVIRNPAFWCYLTRSFRLMQIIDMRSLLVLLHHLVVMVFRRHSMKCLLVLVVAVRVYCRIVSIARFEWRSTLGPTASLHTWAKIAPVGQVLEAHLGLSLLHESVNHTALDI